MPSPTPKTVVTINSSGRQTASFVRVAAAIGWRVRAQMRDTVGIVATELCSLPNVDVVTGELDDPRVIARLFEEGAPGAAPIDYAFVNTTHWGDEVAIGRALADAARRAKVKHYVYSSMPDHGVFDVAEDGREEGEGDKGRGAQRSDSTKSATTTTTPTARPWRPLPLWSQKFAVEKYIRETGLPATFVYCGIYHNNFTSLAYPLFRLELLDGGSGSGSSSGSNSKNTDAAFEWCAPFHEHHRLPWLDAEHDVGPAVLQIFKEGPRKWGGQR